MDKSDILKYQKFPALVYELSADHLEHIVTSCPQMLFYDHWGYKCHEKREKKFGYFPFWLYLK